MTTESKLSTEIFEIDEYITAVHHDEQTRDIRTLDETVTTLTTQSLIEDPLYWLT